MQDEINEKTIALYIKTGKLTAQTLQKAMKTLLAQMKKQKDKTPQGKQTLKQLMKQNAGVSNIEITEGNIKAFESTAKKYGIDFALKKDTTESPPRYLVFFKGRDADVLTAAFKELDTLTEHMWFWFYKMLFCRQRNNFTTTGRTLAYIFIIKKVDNGRCIHIFQFRNIFFAAKDVSAHGNLFLLISG